MRELPPQGSGGAHGSSDMTRIIGGNGSAIRKTAEWGAEFQRRARRVLVICDDGHQRIVVERFYYLPDRLDDWHWLWDRDLAGNHLAASVLDEDVREMLPLLHSPEIARPRVRAHQIRLGCPRCDRSAIRSWAAWADALDILAKRGLWEITLADVERYAVGAIGRRGSGR